MIKEGKIGVQEAISLIVITIAVKVYFTSPTYLAEATGTSCWYTTLLSAATALLGFLFICTLLNRFPGKDLIEIFNIALGRSFGVIFSIVLCGFFVINGAMLLREFEEVLKVYVLPLTPVGITVGTLLIAASGICFMGLEALARFAKLIIWVLLISYVTIIVLNYNNYDIENLFPFGGYGTSRTIYHGLTRSSFYGDVIVLGLIASSLQGINHIRKAGIKAIIISGIITSLGLMTTMMAFNYATAQEITSRLFVLTRIIHLGGFIQRLDPLFIFSWNIGSMVSITTIFYAAVSTYSKIFKMQDMRPLIIPFGIIIFTLSILPRDFTNVTDYVHVLRESGWMVSFAMPLFVLIIAVLRKKKGGGKSA